MTPKSPQGCQSALFLCLFIASLLVFPMLSATTAHAEEYTGRVVGVSDGDTLTLLTPEKRQIRVRLAEIDTPESRQPYGTRAKQALSDLAFNQQARVVVQDTDRFGRTVGRVYVGSTDVNAELVRQGAAWVYRQYARDQSLFALENEARTAKRGLWALPEAERTPPWEWRRAQRGGTGGAGSAARDPAPATRPVADTTPAATAQPAAGGFTCGGKRTCGEMSSCAEAKFHLNSCGLHRLDGDNNGVPCEKLCR